MISDPDNASGASNVKRPSFTALSITLEAQKPMPICMIFDGFSAAFDVVSMGANRITDLSGSMGIAITQAFGMLDLSH